MNKQWKDCVEIGALKSLQFKPDTLVLRCCWEVYCHLNLICLEDIHPLKKKGSTESNREKIKACKEILWKGMFGFWDPQIPGPNLKVFCRFWNLNQLAGPNSSLGRLSKTTNCTSLVKASKEQRANFIFISWICVN